jgi:phosphoribosylformimino-5-aminoimidazole carboxamide ribotide isomerase
MLIPSIDLRGGKVVQLVQGERLAIEDADLAKWVERFRAFPTLQLIDLDAAIGTGDNDALVRRVCGWRPCRVGGGIRSVERARAVLDAGATHVIVGSSLFRDGRPDLGFARRLADAAGAPRVIAAVDTRGGQVVIHGWRTTLPLTAVEAVRALEPYCSEFLCTIVDGEGMMRGIDMDAVRAVRAATTRRLVAAGGITTREEIEALDALDVDAVVGMALYTGRLSIDDLAPGGERRGGAPPPSGG